MEIGKIGKIQNEKKRDLHWEKMSKENWRLGNCEKEKYVR